MHNLKRTTKVVSVMMLFILVLQTVQSLSPVITFAAQEINNAKYEQFEKITDFADFEGKEVKLKDYIPNNEDVQYEINYKMKNKEVNTKENIVIVDNSSVEKKDPDQDSEEDSEPAQSILSKQQVFNESKGIIEKGSDYTLDLSHFNLEDNVESVVLSAEKINPEMNATVTEGELDVEITETSEVRGGSILVSGLTGEEVVNEDLELTESEEGLTFDDIERLSLLLNTSKEEVGVTYSYENVYFGKNEITQTIDLTKAAEVVEEEEAASESEEVEVNDAASTKAVEEDNQVVITKDNFLDYFELHGDAVYNKYNGIVTLTNKGKYNSGSITLKSKVDLNKQFILNTESYISKGKTPADGIAFFFAQDQVGKVGKPGSSIGMTGISNAYGFKLDTHYNKADARAGLATGDPSWFWGSNAPFVGYVKTDEYGLTHNVDTKKKTNYKPVKAKSKKFYDNWVSERINIRNGVMKLDIASEGSPTSNIYQNTRVVLPNREPGTLTISATTGNNFSFHRIKIKDATFSVSSAVDKKVVDEDGDGIASPGEKLNYTLTQANNGSGDYAWNIKDEITDKNVAYDKDQRVNMQYKKISTGEVVSENYNYTIAQLIKGIDVEIEPGQQVDINFDVTVKEDVAFNALSINNTVVACDMIDTQTQCETSKASIPLQQRSLDIRKEADDANGDATAQPGEKIDYTVTLDSTIRDEDGNPVLSDEDGEPIETKLENVVVKDDLAKGNLTYDPTAPIKIVPSSAANGKEYTIQDLVDGSVRVNVKGEVAITYQANAKDDLTGLTSIVNNVVAVSQNGQGDSFTAQSELEVPEGSVTVKYESTDGLELEESETLTGQENETYNLEGKIDDHLSYFVGRDVYVLSEIEGNLKGTFGRTHETVRFVYEKDNNVDPREDIGTVEINYVDEEGQELRNTRYMTGNIGVAYEVQEISTIEKDGVTYAFSRAQGNTTGVYAEDKQVVTMIYAEVATPGDNEGIVKVNYVDMDGNSIQDSNYLVGEVDTNYDVKAPGFIISEDGTRVYAKVGIAEGSAPEQGVYTAVLQEVTVEYRNNKEGAVEVSYVDQAGKELLPTTTLTGDYEEEYVVEEGPISINKGSDVYKLSSREGNLKGTFTKETQKVVFTYELDKGLTPQDELGVVEVRYEDTRENELQGSTYLVGKVGTAYQVEETLAIFTEDGVYTLSGRKGSAKGNFTTARKTVTFLYEYNEALSAQVSGATRAAMSKDELEKALGTVEVNFLDEEGEEVHYAAYVTGTIDSEYAVNETSSYVVDGQVYKLVSREGNITGTWTAAKQYVTFYYELDATLKESDELGSVETNYVNEEGTSLVDRVEYLTGKVGSKYQVENKNFEGYILDQTIGKDAGDFAAGIARVTKIYGEKSGTVTVEYKDTEGKELAAADQYVGVIGHEYTIEAKDIKGYEVDSIEEITSTRATQADGVYSAEDRQYLATYKEVSTEEGNTGDENNNNGNNGNNNNNNNNASESNESSSDSSAGQEDSSVLGKVLPSTGVTGTVALSMAGILLVLAVVVERRRSTIK